MDGKSVIYVTHATPSNVGNGGMHRSYQILHELEELVGKDRVLLLTRQILQTRYEEKEAQNSNGLFKSRRKIEQWISFRSGTVARVIKNPYRILNRTVFGAGLMPPAIKDFYENEMRGLSGKAVCLIDHAEFTELIQINQKFNIPTISCTQNLDGLSDNFLLLQQNLEAIGANEAGNRQRIGVYAAVTDFANELQMLARCDERIFISKIEAGLINGLGLSSHYHPYLPVGAVRDCHQTIRERRDSREQEPGLFLMIGTAIYGPIRKSCEWLIENAGKHGLPPGTRVVVVGSGTETLLQPGKSVDGIELKGWVEQEELDELLTRVKAVLIPQQFGLGAPTRLAELSCAGIPMLGCRPPTYAIDSPPGFHVLEACWNEWYAKIEQLSNEDVHLPEEDYRLWEAAQPKPLKNVINMLFN
ncbi:MAG: hypothetical protein QOH25_3947 [Acidobacteriota bacterium]|jgi:hypothetical protein|nr:hypothetical protein [Acidobacteriota bacterium]